MSTTQNRAALAASLDLRCQYCQEIVPPTTRAHAPRVVADTCDTCLYCEVTIRYGCTAAERERARRELLARTRAGAARAKEVAL